MTALLLLAGCANQPVALTVNVLTRGHVYHEAPFVRVMDTFPSASYTSIARLKAQAGPGLDSAQIVDAMKARAQQLGANGLVVRHEASNDLPSVTLNPAGGQYGATTAPTNQIYTGVAIRINQSSNDKSGTLPPS